MSDESMLQALESTADQVDRLAGYAHGVVATHAHEKKVCLETS